MAALPQDLVRQLHDSGVRLIYLADDRLAAEPASRLTDEARALIRQHKAELIQLLRPRRPIVEYRIEGDSTWYTMLGRPGESYEDAAAACRQQFGNVHETRPRKAGLSSGFRDNGPAAA